MTLPRDVAIARGQRALRTAMLATLGSAFVLGVLALAIVILAARPGSPVVVWPGLSTLLVGQAAALGGGAACFLGLTRVLRAPEDPAPALAGSEAGLRRLEGGLPIALVLVSAAWLLDSPGAALQALVCSLVSAQYVLVSRAVRRTALGAPPAGGAG